MPDLEDMSFKMIRKELARLEGNSRELKEIRAMLIVHCRPRCELSELGIDYNNDTSIFNNVVGILRELVRKIDAKDS